MPRRGHALRLAKLYRRPERCLIVLHQMGNHGPAYYKRYPKEFERFTPVCRTNDLGSCSSEEINNAYDNVILYTDHVMSQVIAILKANDEQFETSMLYVSDHGESLGEYEVYLHGLPYALAPEDAEARSGRDVVRQAQKARPRS